MKVDLVTALTSERNINLEKTTSLYKYFCGCNSEDCGGSQPVSRCLLFLISQERDSAWETLSSL